MYITIWACVALLRQDHSLRYVTQTRRLHLWQESARMAELDSTSFGRKRIKNPCCCWWVTLVLFRRRALGEHIGAEQRIEALVRKSRQKQRGKETRFHICATP
jgi:hypothetical protein